MSTVTDSFDDSLTSGSSASEPVLTVRAVGELGDIPAMTRALGTATSAPPGTAVTVDLSAVTYLSFEALPPLVDLVRHAADNAVYLCVIASGPVRRKLALLGLDVVIPLRSPTG
ncbi:hypothetical protein BS329_37575 [Amycolatopsis coloradensis]|uniref:STAS domain-containing protein n=1 Tax=Amycolatopsis coloradensis TaxID=76021 RepID=A0A1R0KFI9_9PSEU|nr:hypothetical protein [Amycolatopsis coloradensis]OLZ44142.1 hypothetical protein BS329_37575 [Amycolatopsis coloradensis]